MEIAHVLFMDIVSYSMLPMDEQERILRDLQEMEYREIADVLGIPEGTVKSRINRGRAELARLLRKQKLVV